MLPDKPHGEIILYQTKDGHTKLDVRLEDETVWLTQDQMALLFDKNKRTISEHIRNIFKEGELDEISVVRKFRTTAADGNIGRINLEKVLILMKLENFDKAKPFQGSGNPPDSIKVKNERTVC